MRVISGIARGRKLIAPEGLHTRPVTDQIKEALFNIWQFDIEGSNFLDLFSGSGSMGIEAISRGAAKVIMVDNSLDSYKVINTNLKNTQLDKQKNYQVRKEDVFAAIRMLGNAGEKFDIVYADPPYTVDSIFLPTIEALSDGKLLKEDGIVVIRSAKEKQMPEAIGVLEKYRERKYGISMVHFYQMKKENIEEV